MLWRSLYVPMIYIRKEEWRVEGRGDVDDVVVETLNGN